MMANIVPNMAYPPEPFLYLASRIKSEVDVPVMHAQNIKTRCRRRGSSPKARGPDRDDACPHRGSALATNCARAVRRDPPVRRRNYCIDRNYRGADVLCIQNAATGRERSIPHIVPRAARSLRVVVVGGGRPHGSGARVRQRATR